MATEQHQQQRQKMLNSKDLENALDYIATFGRPHKQDETLPLFNYIFDLKDKLIGRMSSHEDVRMFVESDAGRRMSEGLVKALDADGDGHVTPRDLQTIYESKLKGAIRNNSDTLDTVIPWAGQWLVGIGSGYLTGRVIRRVYARKYFITLAGATVYTGLQFLAQRNFIEKQLLEAAFKRKVKELADANGDGVVNADDLSCLVENRMRHVSTKLGFGGVAPGVLGYLALAVGMRRGLRRV